MDATVVTSRRLRALGGLLHVADPESATRKALLHDLVAARVVRMSARMRKRAMRGQSRVSFTAARDAGTRRATTANHGDDLRASYAPSLVGDARSHLYVRALERRMLPLDAPSRAKSLARLGCARVFTVYPYP